MQDHSQKWLYKCFQLPQINQSRFSVLKQKNILLLICKYFSLIAHFLKINIVKVLSSKILVKIFKETRMKIVKMVKNMSQQIKAKELIISRIGISEISKFQSTASVLD